MKKSPTAEIRMGTGGFRSSSISAMLERPVPASEQRQRPNFCHVARLSKHATRSTSQTRRRRLVGREHRRSLHLFSQFMPTRSVR